MRIGAYCNVGYLGISLVVLTVASGTTLLGQGAAKVSRPAGSATTSSEASSLEPARGILHTLVGTWRFEVWFAGNFGGAPDASGTRLVTTLFDDLRLQWIEELDHSPVQARGIIGFDANTGRFFWSAVSSAGSGAQMLTGSLDGAEPMITFRPIADSGDQSFALTILDANHFRSAALDHSWRAVFTRQP